ncbi:hypothetical protein QVD17_15755 [Tagetes erecta]|uniref:Uncharacterized protein n=1 Tax=Tagetes erecta TaxID=13708 RepID=A0AAD8KQ79_TARER|nr:hypothetical protein QVD17_15755 [Tagetes erecta]
MFVQEDMFLLENQIPYQVLTEVMKVVHDVDWELKIIRFIDGNILAAETRRRRRLVVINDRIPTTINHLLELLQTRLTKDKTMDQLPHDWYTFGNANELMEVGRVRFKPSQARTLARIKFTKSWPDANIELPAIIVNDSTKPIMLNLVAYEMCSNDTNASWVTSYICLLDSLIHHPDDAMVLRNAGILDNRLGSDEEVVQLFNEIGKDLVPNNYIYSDARRDIQKHYERWRNTMVAQLKREYIRNPWQFTGITFGVLSLYFAGLQTYFTIWGKGSH